MIALVDTSVWSLVLRRRPNVLSAKERTISQELTDLVIAGTAKLIGPVRQEVLTGIRDRAMFTRLRERLRSLPDEPLEAPDFELAAEIANRCIAGGVAVVNTDLLLCAVAHRRRWTLMTMDRDFLHYPRFCQLHLHLHGI